MEDDNGKLRLELTDDQFSKFEAILDEFCIKDNEVVQSLLSRPKRWSVNKDSQTNLNEKE